MNFGPFSNLNLFLKAHLSNKDFVIRILGSFEPTVHS
jgi:hypothetical protein